MVTEMNEFELFTLIYFVLDSYYDPDDCDDFTNTVISDMGPFTFEDIGSADPIMYDEYLEFLNGRKITIENSFDIAKEYVRTITYADVNEAMESLTEEEWRKGAEKYLSEPHKGMDVN
jgi:hypothetical protein